MKVKASLTFRSINGSQEYRCRRRGRRQIRGREGVLKAGRYKVSAPLSKRKLKLFKKARKY